MNYDNQEVYDENKQTSDTAAFLRIINTVPLIEKISIFSCPDAMVKNIQEFIRQHTFWTISYEVKKKLISFFAFLFFKSFFLQKITFLSDWPLKVLRMKKF